MSLPSTVLPRQPSTSLVGNLPATDDDCLLDGSTESCLNACLTEVATSSITLTLTELQNRHETLRKHRQELRSKLQQTDARMAQIRAAMGNLAALNGELPTYNGQLADAIRAILAVSYGEGSTAKEVRQSLLAIGYDLKKHSNPMAAIHGVLKRLSESHDVEVEKDAQGNTRYLWGSFEPESDAVLKWLAGSDTEIHEPSKLESRLSEPLLVALRRHAILDAQRKARTQK